MKGYVIAEYGDAEKAFELQDISLPSPGPGQVQIKVQASGLNYADVMARKGMYRDAPPLPALVGYDVAGAVSACGQGVDEQWMGKRVVGLTRFGGYAEYAVTDTRAIAEIPDEMQPQEAVALATQYCTAWYSACEMTNLFPGQIVLVHAAAGGVGTALVQISKMRGCTVIGTCGSAAKMDYVKQQGADHVINYNESDYEETIKSIFPDKKLDAAFNSLGGSTFRKDMRLVGAAGRVVCFGGAARKGKGFFSTLKFGLGFGFFHPVQLLIKSKTVIGVNMLQIADFKAEVIQRCMQSVVKEVKAGHLKPHVGGTFPAEEIAKAHRALEDRSSIGKLSILWE